MKASETILFVFLVRVIMQSSYSPVENLSFLDHSERSADEHQKEWLKSLVCNDAKNKGMLLLLLQNL